MKREVIVHKNPKSPISEIFRTLRTNIQFMNTNKQMKSLLVTSTNSGEGKSWVTANLGVTFAQAGKKVILLDADMRKGREYAIFGASPTPGLSNYLSQTETTQDLKDYIQETEVENLYVITAGSVPPNPSELLVSTQMIDLLEQLKQLCDIVIIDGTPCELVTDSVILSRITDSTIIVTAHKKTKKDDLARVVRNIQNVGGNIAGVVLNRVPSTSKKFGEQYYYGGIGTKQDSEEKKSHIKKMKIFNEKIDKNILDLQDNKNNNKNKETASSKEKDEENNQTKDNAKNNSTKNEYKDNNVKTENKTNHANNANNQKQNEHTNNNINNNKMNNNNMNNDRKHETKGNKAYNNTNGWAQEKNNAPNNNQNNTVQNNNNNIQIQDKKENEKEQSEDSAFLNKTNEILKQINDYLDNEKKKMK